MEEIPESRNIIHEEKDIQWITWRQQTKHANNRISRKKKTPWVKYKFEWVYQLADRIIEEDILLHIKWIKFLNFKDGGKFSWRKKKVKCALPIHVILEE